MQFTLDVGTLISGGVLISIAVLVIRNNGHVDQKIENFRDDIEKVEDKKVEKDLCKIVSKGYENDIKELKKKVDCIPSIKAGVDLLLERGKK